MYVGLVLLLIVTWVGGDGGMGASVKIKRHHNKMAYHHQPFLFLKPHAQEEQKCSHSLSSILIEKQKRQTLFLPAAQWKQ